MRLEFPSVVTSKDPVSLMVHVTNRDGVTARGTGEYDYAVQPADLASVTRRGIVTCNASGDGTVSVTIAGASKSVPLRCRVVERIEAAAQTQIELAAGPYTPKLRVLGKGGRPLSDVDVALSSKNTGILVSKGKELIPKEVGRATIIARAGQITQEFLVDVVRRLEPEALPIEGNRRIHYSLQPGKYQLSVKLPTPKPLSVEWRGAPYCNYSKTEREHVSVCVLRAKGGAVFDNPAYLLEGKSDVVSLDGVSLYEVP